MISWIKTFLAKINASDKALHPCANGEEPTLTFTTNASSAVIGRFHTMHSMFGEVLSHHRIQNPQEITKFYADLGINFKVYRWRESKGQHLVLLPQEYHILPEYADFFSLKMQENANKSAQQFIKHFINSDSAYGNQFWLVNSPEGFCHTNYSDCEHRHLMCLDLEHNSTFKIDITEGDWERNIVQIYNEGHAIDILSYLEFIPPKPKRVKKLNKAFPQFKYFADPLAENMFIESTEECIVCERITGYINNFFEDDGPFCPWCTANGKAATELDLTFNDFIVNDFDPDTPSHSSGQKIKKKDLITLCSKTPCPHSIQQFEWHTCCGDICRFETSVTRENFETLPESAKQSISTHLRSLTDNEEYAQLYINNMDGVSAMGYLSQCLHCHTYYFSQDCD